MNDRKNIDRLFQEKLKGFEATPKDAVWEQIENRLHKDKRKRRVIPLWWKAAGVAALLALLLTVGNSIFNNSTQNDTTTTPVVEIDDSSLDKGNTDERNTLLESSNTQNITQEDTDAINHSETGNINNDPLTGTSNKISSEVATSATSSKKDKAQKNKEDLLNKTTDGITHNETKVSKSTIKDNSEIDALIDDAKNTVQNTIVDGSESTKKEDSSLTETALDKENEDGKKEEENTEDTTIEDAIAETTDKEEEEEEEKLVRWSVSSNVAPVYFNTLGKGSSIDNQFINNSKSGELNLSYGIGGSYALNKKLKIRAGINKVELGYNTNNVIAYYGPNSSANGHAQLRNVKFNNPVESATFLSADNLNFGSVPQILTNNIKASIDQRLGFIEIPLEIEYNIINKKMGLNVIGGFSTLFLNKNEVYSTLDGNRTLIGEATNINNTSYSANFGIGVNYQVSEKININLEPMFKYQINTFNDSSGDFQPYFIGVYTGLSFKF